MKFYHLWFKLAIYFTLLLNCVLLSKHNDIPKSETDLSDTSFLIIGSDIPSENSKPRTVSHSHIQYFKFKKYQYESQNEKTLEEMKVKEHESSPSRESSPSIETKLDIQSFDNNRKRTKNEQENINAFNFKTLNNNLKYARKTVEPNDGSNENENKHSDSLNENINIKFVNKQKEEDQTEIVISSDEAQENESNKNIINSEFEDTIFDHIDYEDDIHENWLPDCSEKLKYNAPLLVISTLDGQISGLNYLTGEVIWSHKTNSDGSPMLSSSISKLEVASRGEFVRLIPSLDGAIYQFDGEDVEALPITADTLLHSSFKYNEDTIFSGGKYSEILGIFPSTGEIKYTCDNNGCPGKQSTSSGNQVLVVRRVSQTVRAIDPKTGDERWNFSVGQHEVNLASTGCESLKSKAIEEDLSLPSLNFVLPDGVVIAVDKKLRTTWQQKLSSPIINAWSLQEDNLEAIDLFSSNSVPALQPQEFDEELEIESGHRQPALYVGVHRGQLYIQQNLNFKREMNMLLHKIINNKNPFEQVFPKVNWKPYLASADSRTPVINHGTTPNHPLLLDYERKDITQDLAVRHNIEYPFENQSYFGDEGFSSVEQRICVQENHCIGVPGIDNGYYLYNDNNEDGVFNESNYWIPLDRNEEESIFEGDITSQIYYICFEAGPTIYWKIFIALTIYASFHFLVLRVLFRNAVNNVQRRINERVLATLVMLLQNIFREHPQLLGILERMGYNRLPLPPSTTTQVEQENSRSNAESTQRQDSNFSSRYTSDFEPVLCLGKGGFGVVFQVKNKLDENEYAVKRIILPSKESSAERVKREVRALAKLNHTNIVRYYNSWIESPPVGWEEEADSWWKINGAASSLLSPELDESEPPIENSHHPLFAKNRPKENQSLSSIVNKLNFQHLLPSRDASSSEACRDGSGGEVDCESKNGGNHVEEEDSFDVVFENSDGNDNSKIDFEVIADYEEGDESSLIDSNKIIKNDYSKLTCQTRSFSSKNDSIMFWDSGKKLKTKRELKNKSNSLFPTSSQKNVSPYTKKRKERQSLCDEGSLPDRPVSLDIKSSNRISDFSDNLKVIANEPPTPNPRTYLYIQMELCQKESLKEWLFSNPERQTQQLYSFFNDIVHAVEYVHDRSLMHRDLKPSNIFFSLDGEIKIGDFGLVTTIEDENNVITPLADNPSCSDPTPLTSQKQRTLNAGTHLYMSPEQIAGQSYTYKVDIYSLGLIFFEMLVPFSTEMERREVMLKARNKIFPSWFSREFSDVEKLLQLTLHPNPICRPTTRGIRARQPLGEFQKGEAIKEDEHFHLLRQRTHSRSYSGSFTSSSSS